MGSIKDNLDKIVEELTSDNSYLPTTLRKAMILASDLHLSELSSWLNQELNGYDDNSLPSYRIVKAISQAKILTTTKIFEGVSIPTTGDQDIDEYASSQRFGNGIAALEQLLNSPKDYIETSWPQNLIDYFSGKFMYSHVIDTKINKSISKASIAQILDSVRNKLLGFCLEVRVLIGDVETPDATEGIKETGDKLRDAFNVNIYGGHNVVAQASRIEDLTINVTKYNIESVKAYLTSSGFNQEQVLTLCDAITQDGARNKDEGFGAKVKEWIAKLPGFLGDVSQKLSIETAAGIAVKVISMYYGWNI